ncbi:MAG: 50S ribosomal protein L11 methyltransferase [Deltaproteobacteria bacterium]|nr:50S ribosomal protein L11 methyltransferase [Deltaproteobacteria bacterium]
MQQIIEATLYFPQGTQVIAESLLREHGISSFIEGSSTLTLNPEEINDIYTCYFSSEEELFSLTTFLNNHFPTKIAYKLRYIDNQDWQTSWQKHWKIEKLGNVIIVPHFLDYKQKAGEIVITINPQMAFGTGTHETTKLCAQAIIEIFNKTPMSSFLDVGCGTGILSILASKLGATDIAAVDIEEDIIITAKGNCQHNGVKNISFSSSSLNDLSMQPFELVCANIISSELKKLWPRIQSLVSPEGTIILSGILKDEVEEFKTHLNLNPTQELQLNNWITLILASKKSNSSHS